MVIVVVETAVICWELVAPFEVPAEGSPVLAGVEGMLLVGLVFTAGTEVFDAVCSGLFAVTVVF